MILALIFAVGAWHAVGAMWESVVGRGLPYRDPSALVSLRTNSTDSFTRLLRDREVAILRERAESFLWVGFFSFASPRSLGDPSIRTVTVSGLEPGFLDGLGASPLLGRAFLTTDHEARARRNASSAMDSLNQGQAVALLSHDLWQTVYGGSRDVVGTEIMLSGEPTQVIGVMPPGFYTPRRVSEAWVPAKRAGSGEVSHGAGHVYARLRPGVTPTAAADEASTLLQRAGFRRERHRVVAVPLGRELTASVRPTLELLRTGAFLLLLAAAASVAGLRLARSRTAYRAAVVRRALGASLGDEILSVVSRVTLIALAVSAGSVLVAAWVLPLLRRFGGDLPFAEVWAMGWIAAAEAFVMALLAAALAELAPLVDSLRNRRSWTGNVRFGLGGRREALPPSLVLGVAASTIVLILTVVIGGSAAQLLSGRGGYADRRLAQISVDFGGNARGNSRPHAETVNLLDRLIERISALPEVESAAYADFLPDEIGGTLTFRGNQHGEVQDSTSGRATRAISPGLFRTLGIPVLQGRGIAAADQPVTEQVIVLDRAYVASLELSDPVGEIVEAPRSSLRVVGLVPDTRVFPDTPAYPAGYVPFAQASRRRHVKVEVVVRFRDAPTLAQVSALGRLPGEVDSSLRTTRVATVRDRRIRQFGAPLLAAAALAIFAVAGLMLAVVGGVGHIADFQVREAQSTAIRMAAGAEPRTLVREACRSAALAATAGVMAGTVSGWILARFVAIRVPWLETSDPRFYFGPAGGLLMLMLLVAIAAGWRTLPRDPWAVLKTL